MIGGSGNLEAHSQNPLTDSESMIGIGGPFFAEDNLKFSLFFCMHFFLLRNYCCIRAPSRFKPTFYTKTSLAFAGWINAIQLIEDRSDFANYTGDNSALNVVPIMYTCCATLWTLLFASTSWKFTETGQAYKKQSHSVEGAREEFNRTTGHESVHAVTEQRNDVDTQLNDVATTGNDNRV